MKRNPKSRRNFEVNDVMRCYHGFLITFTLLGLLLFACKEDDDTTDLLPDCKVGGMECRNGLECFSNESDLQCGYCTKECGGGASCPVGTGCAYNDLCLVKCGESGDCPRGYQVCNEGFCVSPADEEVSCD